MVRIRVKIFHPKSQFAIATAMLAIASYFAQSFPSWWKFAACGFILGVISGVFWQRALNNAPQELSNTNTLTEFLRLFHSSYVGKVHTLLEWVGLGVILYLANTLTNQFSISGLVIGCAVSTATSSVIHIFSVLSYENTA